MMKRLRELAKKNGTYFGPGYPNGGLTAVSSPAWSGAVSFNSSNQVNNGIVFVDTVDGQDIPTNLLDQNPATFADVTVHGNRHWVSPARSTRASLRRGTISRGG